MYNKILVVAVASIVLWQVATSFVIKDQETKPDVTDYTQGVFHSVSVSGETLPPAIVVDEDEIPPAHIAEEEKNTTSGTKSDDINLNVNTYAEQVSKSQIDGKEEVQLPTHHVKDVDNVTLAVEDDEKEIENEKHEAVTSSPSSESDEEKEKSRRSKHSQYEEDNEVEEDEGNESTNKNDHENDE